jgi:hypothetical protein
MAEAIKKIKALQRRGTALLAQKNTFQFYCHGGRYFNEAGPISEAGQLIYFQRIRTAPREQICCQ